MQPLVFEKNRILSNHERKNNLLFGCLEDGTISNFFGTCKLTDTDMGIRCLMHFSFYDRSSIGFKKKHKDDDWKVFNAISIND